MMNKLMKLWNQYREALMYLIFGGLTTLVNVGAFMLLKAAGLTTGAANALALTLSILFAYVTNKLWVFESREKGLNALKEFAMFIACRIATGFMDQIIVVLGVDKLGSLLNLADSSWWALAVKVFANVLVIIANYVFSKLLIFRHR
ncbi:MAG: GtrA family protein [Clostridia bacterium]|nr:GtrA family protein [Clostridia bacterium]